VVALGHEAGQILAVKPILALDQGTTSSRASVFDHGGGTAAGCGLGKTAGVGFSETGADLFVQMTAQKLFCFGHRGASGHEPENTVRSVRRALELGTDGIEVRVFGWQAHKTGRALRMS